MTATHAQTQVKRHPIRGGVYGLLLGLGAAIYLVIFAVAPFSVSTTAIVVGLCVLLGILWGAFAPAKQPGTVPPSRTSLGSTFSRAGGAEDTTSESYEATFGEASPAAEPPEEGASFGEPPANPGPPK